ncbi:MAG: DUF4832 domain-containing protein, partial [Bacteroidota bacterium]
MKSRFALLFTFFCLLTLGTQAQTTTINYQNSNDDFANPERGFYRYSETRSPAYNNLDAATLAGYRNLHQPLSDPNFFIYSTLVFRYFFLEDFKMSPVSQSFLNDMEDDFEAARTAGVKIIVRMAYTDETGDTGCGNFICPPYGDAPKQWILQHIEQLKPIFFANKDVIAAIQMGFIGTWGENYYTDYFGNASQSPFQLLDNNWNDRNEVLQALLDATPKDRMIQVRYPQLKQRLIYGINAPTTSAPLLLSEAYDQSDKARLGFHNDCFLASDADFGTYENYGNSSSSSGTDTTNLKPYKAADSKYVVVGGETCNSNRSYDPFDDCAPTGRADTELRRFHYSYLNSQYNYPDVNVDWQNDCMEDIKRELGYRFVLQNATFTNAVRPGQRINININLENEGYAAPFNTRGVELVLRNTSTQATYFAPLNSDPRFWFDMVNINENLCLPNDLPTGNYELLLHLPDQEATLYGRSEYAIRLANKLPNNSDVWEAATGYNRLGHTLVVNNSANQPSCGNATVFSSCTAKLIVSRIEQNTYEVQEEILSTATLESGVNSTFKAGEQIILQAPFHAKNGSTFAAKIESNCNTSSALMENIDIATIEDNLQKQQGRFAVYPNPSTGEIRINYDLEEGGAIRIQLMDANGKVMAVLLNHVQSKGAYQL